MYTRWYQKVRKALRPGSGICWPLGAGFSMHNAANEEKDNDHALGRAADLP